MKKSARIDQLKIDQMKMASMPIWHVRRGSVDDVQKLFPGKIIRTNDYVDAITYVGVDPAWQPSDYSLARQLLQEVWEEDQEASPSQGK